MILPLLVLVAQAAMPQVVAPQVAPLQAAPRPPRAAMDRDGAITRAEMIARAEAAFARQDADGNGTVTAEERRAARQAMVARRPDRPMPPEGRPMRGAMADGPVTLAEARAQAGRRFDRLDANRDGKLDASERPGRGGAGGRRDFGNGDMPPPPPAD